MHAHQAFEQFASSGAEQTVDPQNFTPFKVHAHVIQSPSAAPLGKAQILYFQNILCL